MSTNAIAQLGYVGIGVKDVKAWEEFGTNVIGLELSEKLGDGTLYLRQDEYHHRFIIEPTGEDDIKYAGFMVHTLEDLKEIQARVTADGVKVEEGSPEECAHRKVNRFITFKDPDDMRVEVFLGLDVIVERPMTNPPHIRSGFITGKMGLGHILVNSKDVEENERFYRDVLGFKISDYIYTGGGERPESKLVFMHVNPRHHSYAVCQIPGMTKHLTHWMMQVGTLDDVGRTYDVVRDRGIPVNVELGKHSNDQMVSFYMTTPSNFMVEIGMGGREIDDSEWVVQQHHSAQRETAPSKWNEYWGHRGLGRGLTPWSNLEEALS